MQQLLALGCWRIWKCRNSATFHGETCCPEEALNNLKYPMEGVGRGRRQEGWRGAGHRVKEYKEGGDGLEEACNWLVEG